MTDRIHLYSWTDSYRPGVQPEVAAAEFKRIEAEHGLLTPEVLVDASRDEHAVLHNVFEWDDTVAGTKYRHWQANRLLGSLRVTVKSGDTPAPSRVSMQIVGSAQPSERSYIAIESVANDEQDRIRFLLDELGRIEGHLRRTENFHEMEPIRASCRVVRRALMKEQRAAKAAEEQQSTASAAD